MPMNMFMVWMGIGAISIPIVIHLLNKRKFERVVWAAMRFLKVSVEQNQRRIQVEDILLLILRCLLLILLGYALSRPRFDSPNMGGWFGRAEVSAIVLVDNSYSMTAAVGNKTRFDLAKETAQKAIESLPPGSSVAVLMTSDTVPTGPIPEPTKDIELARRLVRDAVISDRSSDLYPGIRKAAQLLKDRYRGTREMYVITDGQSLAWKQFDQVRRQIEEVRHDIKTQVFLVGSTLSRNLGVSGLRQATPLAIVDHSLQFQVEVTNYGQDRADNVRVVLRVGDAKDPSDEGIIETVPAGSSRIISLFARMPIEGTSTVTAEIDPDALPADDRRTIAVRALSQLKVLLVDGEPNSGGRDSEVFYLWHALNPVPRAELDKHFIKTKTIDSQYLEDTPLSDFDVVFLCNVPDFTKRGADLLAAYLQRGGGLVIFPGAQSQAKNYNDLLAEQHKMLPRKLGEGRGDPARDDQFLLFQDKNFEHPIAADLGQSAANVHFFRTIELLEFEDEKNGPETSISAGQVEIGRPRTVLRYQDGQPAMMERRWGAGRVVLFSSTADTSWNDLGARPNVFIPLIYRTLGSIMSRQEESLNVRVGQPIRAVTDGPLAGVRVEIARPFVEFGQAGVDSRTIDRDAKGRRGQLVIEETSRAGSYRVRPAESPSAQQIAMAMQAGASRIAAPADAKAAGSAWWQLVYATQANPDESRLDELGGVQMQDLGKVATVTRVSGDAALSNMLKEARSGTEIWKYVAMAALALAAAETLLAHWFSKSK